MYKCKHKISHKKETKEKVPEWLCADEKAHEQEWVNEEKSTVAVRNQIKRQFSAMIAKEKEVKTNKKSKIKIIEIPWLKKLKWSQFHPTMKKL